MNKFLADSVLDLKLSIDSLFATSKEFNFELKHKFLYFISQSERTSPKDLIEFFQMAKSNVANLCAGLQKEGLIAKRKRTGSGKEIYYMLTQKGEEELLSKREQIEDMIDSVDSELVEKLSRELSVLLKRKY